MLNRLVDRGFACQALHHAEAILTNDMPDALTDIENALVDMSIPIEELIRGGGGEGELTQRIRNRLNDELGWQKHRFEIQKIVDGIQKESISHEIDHVKQFNGFTFALEIEWNNKDPFFDRDLENFKRLHADGVISVGAIITRGASFQENIRAHIERFANERGINSIERVREFYTPTSRQIAMIERNAASKGSFEAGWSHAFASDKYGQATTHWSKLYDRVARGVGNPCPLLLIGIPQDIIEHGRP